MRTSILSRRTLDEPRHAVDRRLRTRVVVACLLATGCLLPAGAHGEEPKKTSGVKERDDDLSRRLIDKATNDRPEDLMATILRLMGETAKQLEIEFDPGEQTQTLQTRVLEQLDLAIKQAGRQRRPNSKNQQQSKSDKRRAPKEKKEESNRSKRSGKPRADKNETGKDGDATAGGSGADQGGKLDESRRGWGALPQREREEVIQGASEAYLEQYREWIEQYYRALQESEE